MPRISTDNYDTVASWNGSQDLFIVEQPDGTKVATPAMVKQYILNDMDEVPTQNSDDLVKSGGVFSAIDDVYSVMGQNGAKNLLVPKWTETQTTENGVTYTFNDDGTIIMNTDASGATANTNCNLRDRSITTNNLFLAGSYILTGCPAGGSSTTYRTWARAYRPGTTTALTPNLYDEGNGVSFTVSEPFSLGLNVTVMNGYVCNNLTWKPMLRLASDTDDTYQPYAKTNRQLTEVIGDLSQTGLTGDSVAEQLENLNDDLVLEKFTPTLASAIGTPNTFDSNCFYNPKTKQVHIQVMIYSADALIPTMGQTIFLVDTKYRPANTLQFGMAFVMSSAQFDSRVTRMERCFMGDNGAFGLNNFIYGGQATKLVYIVGDYIAK